MKTRSARTLGAAVLAAFSLAPHGVAMAAQPAVAPSTAPVTSRVDVDGDGRADRTTLRLISQRGETSRFELTVTTARGRTARLPFRLWSPEKLTPRNVWIGATGIDGVRGNEIVLDLGAKIDFSYIHAYAWRNGRLAVIPAAGGTNRDVSWHEMFPPFAVTGYTFSMRGSTRYVVKHDLKASPSGASYSGVHTTYRWTTKGWQRVSSSASGVYSDNAASSRFAGLHGLVWR